MKLTMVILAAGMGSRYGGLKQLDTFTPEGATIMDFSIYDALQAGFEKFVFIIRRSFEEEFKKAFSEKLEGKADVEYVFQEIDNIPKAYYNPKRKKPWGTGHALLTAKDVVDQNFAIINADDFYGKEAFITMANSLRNTNENSYNFKMIAYSLKNTVSDYGCVSRGECQINDENYLIDITERKHIEKVNNYLVQKDKNGVYIPIDGNAIVSMNFWGFTPKCFEFGFDLLEIFLEENRENLTAEFFISLVINEMLKSGKAEVEVLKSDAKWFGVTYKEDKEIVQNKIKQLTHNNCYPSKLW
jgi:dTDP-glucose pyrophosphorylase